MVSMRHHNNVVADFEPLVKLLPPSAVATPLRSTLPLVDFWRAAGFIEALRLLAHRRSGMLGLA